MDVATEKETLIVKVNTQNQIMRIVLIVKTKKNTICIQNMFWELGIFMYWTVNSMNNLLSYCGSHDANIRASDIDLPVIKTILRRIFVWSCGGNAQTQSQIFLRG